MKEAKVWKKCLCVVLTFTIFIAGCGGQAANPVDRHMIGDEKKSCDSLYTEVSQIDTEIVLKNRQKGDRDTWNIIFFVTGFLVIVPWFFMDLKGSQEVEREALQARKKALQNMFSEKNCTPPGIKATEKQQKEQTKLLNGAGVPDIASLVRNAIAKVQLQPSLVV